jgi:aspartate carbamoyltransferase catalytic subunit
MMGDLKRGRTVRSLSYLMKNYRGVKLVFIAPDAFRMEPDILDHCREHGIPFTETRDMRSVLPELDALYVTRVQSEHDTQGESTRVDVSSYAIGPAELGLLKPTAVVMHPLPRGPEIHPDVDRDPRAKYWRQERNGMWMRAALLTKIFGLDRQVVTQFEERSADGSLPKL